MKIQKILSIGLALLLCACSPSERSEHELLIGTISGPETSLMEEAKVVAQTEYGLEITIVPFEDYVTPNVALAEGSIDANMFQHQPYLDEMLKERHFKLVSIGKTFIYPMGLYSNRYKNLKDLPQNPVVGVPIDPSNQKRALLLLEAAGIQNPRIKELEAAQLPRALDDLDIAAINTNYAIPAGLVPSTDALLLESKDSPYANIVVVREGEQNQIKYQQLMQALHSEAVKAKAEALFSNQAVVAW